MSPACRPSGESGREALGPDAGGDADQLVLFQVALGALHIDILVGRKLRADPIIRSGTGLKVMATPRFQSSFQILAD